MIKENQAEFKKSNLNIWQKSGYKGQNTTIVVLDDRGTPAKHTNVITPFPEEHRESVDHNPQVCAVVREVAPLSRIISMPWFGVKKPVIDWIFEHKDEIDLINCSFGGTVGKDEFNRLKTLDIPIICASGNDYNKDRINNPARYDWTIAIGAVGEGNDHVVGYSNGGKELDAVAYTNIYIPSYTYGYDKVFPFTGTSCASPYVCGMLACYLSWRKEKNLPKLSREEIKLFVHENSIDMYEEGHDYRSGYGLFVLPKEIPSVDYIPTPTPSPEKPKEDNPPTDSTQEDIELIMSKEDYNKFLNYKMIYDNAKKDGNIVAMDYAKNLAKELLDKYNIKYDYFNDDVPPTNPTDPIPEPPKEPEQPINDVENLILDISHHQNPVNINYDKLAKQIKLAIIRTQYGSRLIDTHYKKHHAEFRKRNVPTAAYAWVRGINIKDMEVEATDFYNRTKDLNPTFWFLDVEEESMTDMKSGIKAYTKKLRELGAKKVGVYIAHHLYEKFNLDMNDFDAIWIPHYGVNNGKINSTPKYSCDIHQYTSTGRLDGYNGDLDLNRLIGNKPLSYYITHEVKENPEEPIEPPKNEILSKINVDLFGNKIAVQGVFLNDMNYIPVRFLEKMGYYVQEMRSEVSIAHKQPDQPKEDPKTEPNKPQLLTYKGYLKKGDTGADVKSLQTVLEYLGFYNMSIDGSFGNGTDTALRNFQKTYGLVVDGFAGQATVMKINELLSGKTQPKYYKYNNAHVLEVDPLDLYVEVVKKAGNTISGDFINGSLFGTFQNNMVSISTLVSDGKIIAEHLPHDAVKRGVFVVYKDGTVAVEMIDFISKFPRLKDIKFAIGGFNIMPIGKTIQQQLKDEWFDWNSVGYKTWRSMLGFDPKKNKVLIVISPDTDAAQGQTLLKQLGCDIGISLDSGGSTCGRFNSQLIRSTTRVLHNIVRWS